MNLDKYTQKSQEALLAGQQLAKDHNHQHIEPVHLLAALLKDDEGIVPAIVNKVAGSLLALRAEVQNDLDGRPRVHGSNVQVGLAGPTSQVLEAAER